jgi:hypothetical protein
MVASSHHVACWWGVIDSGYRRPYLLCETATEMAPWSKDPCYQTYPPCYQSNV